MTQVPLPRKIKKEKEVKKEGKGKTKEERNNEDDHSTRKLEESAMHHCNFDKEWSKKNSCIQPVKEYSDTFFVQFAQRKLVVPIKLLVMFSDTVKRLFILCLKMK